MADIDGQVAGATPQTVSSDILSRPSGAIDGQLAGPAGAPPTYFKMVGTDAALATRDAWVVAGAADTTAAQYAGALTLPLRAVHVAETWTG
jgi:hypothetical protein